MSLASDFPPAKSKSIRTKVRTEAQRRKHEEKSRVLKLIADPTRIGILDILASGPEHVSEIGKRLGDDLSQPAVSHHLALARSGNLIELRRKGRKNIYFLTEKGKILIEMINQLS